MISLTEMGAFNVSLVPKLLMTQYYKVFCRVQHRSVALMLCDELLRILLKF